jgi:hypothetical protein
LNSPTQAVEYYSLGKNVYLKDMNFDQQGNAVALVVVSNGHKPGPDNGLRYWHTIRWNGSQWENREAFTSDHNYDMGSLYIEGNRWWIIAPTDPGPQPWGVGGEMVIWESSDKGETWNKVLQATKNSEFNHAYLRRPVNAHPGFYGFWSDGNPDEFSPSRLYFMDKAGKVFQLPTQMAAPFETLRPPKAVNK